MPCLSTIGIVCAMTLLVMPASARVSFDEGFLCRIGAKGLEQITLYFADRPLSDDAEQSSERPFNIVDDNPSRGKPRRASGRARCAQVAESYRCELPTGQRLRLGMPSDPPQAGYYQLTGELSEANDGFEQRATCLVKAR